VLHYLAALDLALALADRLVTLAEADQLGELAQAMCLGAEELLDLHRSYLAALAAAAVAVASSPARSAPALSGRAHVCRCSPRWRSQPQPQSWSRRHSDSLMRTGCRSRR
jgi:hypothetical protein